MPESIFKRAARRLLHAIRRPRGVVTMRKGQISSLKPLSRKFGSDRGKPIDRRYIESFLGKHSADIHGHVLEVTNDRYSRRFGGSRISRQDILHRDSDNALATISGDLANPATLPKSAFDSSS